MIQLPTLYQGAQVKGAIYAQLIEDLQQYLRGRFPHDKPPIVVDGDFGTKTEAVVRKVQLLEFVEGDGIVGPTTWGKLLAAGFRPSQYVPDPVPIRDLKTTAAWPPKPLNVSAPDGMKLFGKGFSYTPNPSLAAPDAISVSQQWVLANIGTARIPQLRGVAGMLRDSGSVPFNKAAIAQLEALFRVWEHQDLTKRILTFGGTWVPRFIRGRKVVSNHALGTALDLNSQWNPYKTQPALVGKVGCLRELVPTAYPLGFYWGGWYGDGMHLEVYKLLSADELQAVLLELMR